MDNPHYVTPEEAVKMKCQMQMNGTKYPKCYGSDCMAWRWAKLPDMTDDGKIRFDQVYSKTHGYCGMVRP